ncbi:hypothetical protein EIP91_002553 [Steccherinum ochraceum]|uniref:Uncharacterized protein n=1 Tax=Steccherinum ochraceum TaxID=92696 RepID=A0A4R0RI99_9APHY|nr:hypothetical protein EIP91_002553 [Steccherinum ochraceum]
MAATDPLYSSSSSVTGLGLTDVDLSGVDAKDDTPSSSSRTETTVREWVTKYKLGVAILAQCKDCQEVNGEFKRALLLAIHTVSSLALIPTPEGCPRSLAAVTSDRYLLGKITKGISAKEVRATEEDKIATMLIRVFEIPLTPPVGIWYSAQPSSGFSEKYVGDYHLRAIKHIDSCSESYKDSDFGHQVAFVNSPGMGKTSTAIKILKEHPGLLLCFRAQNSGEFPQADEPLTEFLRSDAQDLVKVPEEAVAAFLGGLFEWLNDWLDDHLARHSSVVTVFDPEHLDRQRMAGAVLQNTRRLLKEKQSDLAVIQTKDQLGVRLKSTSESFKRFFVVLDEFPDLELAPLGRSNSFMTTMAFQRIIKAGDVADNEGLTVWFLTLGTNASVKKLVPHKEGSGRLIDSNFEMLPPFTAFGLDQNVSQLSPPGSVADTLLILRLRHYGRPLWLFYDTSNVRTAALSKLAPHSLQLDRHVVLALMGARIHLGLNETSNAPEAAQKLAEEAVRHHMRVLISVTKGIIKTAPPPDPILALAAASFMVLSSQQYKTVLKALQDLLIGPGNIVPLGTKGELATRLLLTLARDAKFCPPSSGLHHHFIDHANSNAASVTPLSLCDLLTALFGDKMVPTLSTNLEIRSLWDTIVGDGIVNFTHFQVESKIINTITEDDLAEYWFRQVAVQCHSQQPVIDGFIVYYCGKLSSPFQKNNLRMMPWQTKARVVAASSKLGSTLTTPAYLDPVTKTTSKHPSLSLLVDLGTASAFGKSPPFSSQISDQLLVTLYRGDPGAEARNKWPNAYIRDEPDRLVINARGHTKSTYPIIDTFQCSDLIASMVGAPFLTGISGVDEITERWAEEISEMKPSPGHWRASASSSEAVTKHPADEEPSPTDQPHLKRPNTGEEVTL